MRLRGLSFLCHMLRCVPPLGPFHMRFLCHFCIWLCHILFCGLRYSMIGIHQCRQTYNCYHFCTHHISWHGLLPIPISQMFLVYSLGCIDVSILVCHGHVRTCTMAVLHEDRCIL